MIKLTQVTNPLLPTVGQVVHELDYQQDRTLDLYLVEVLPENLHVTASLNGHVYAPELWPSIIPCDGDSIVVAPKLAGGSVLKGLAALAVVAVATVVSGGLATGPLAGLGAGVLGSAFAGIGLGSVSALGATLIAGAVAIGGNMLVSALSSKPAAAQQSPSYAFQGPSMLAQSGTPIPKGYGTMRWGGNAISSFVDVEGLDQFLNVLVCFGFGPARSISSIQINGKDISTYQNIQYYLRYGSNGQQPIGPFNRIINGYPQDTQCLAGVPVVVPGTGTLTQGLQVDVVFPEGLFVLTSDGHYIPLSITWLVEYSVSGSGVWDPVITPRTTYDVITFDPITGAPNPYNSWVVLATDLPPNSGIVYISDNGPHTPGDPWSGTQTVYVTDPSGGVSTYTKVFKGEWQPVNIDLNLLQVSDWNGGYQTCSTFGTQPAYFRTNIYGLTPGKYDVRVTKYGSNRYGDSIGPGDNNSPNVGQQIWLHSVNEVSYLNLSYPNMILVGIRALATNQIGGASLNVTALIQHGLRTLDNNILPSALQAFEEDNPACVAADMLLDGLYGGGQWPGILPANLTRFVDEWLAWAEQNDTLVPDGNGNSIRLHVFNGVFDKTASLWDAANAVGRMSRAQLIPIGRDYGVFVEKEDVPVQMFTMGNIVDDSFTESWMDIDSRANQVEIEFADSTRYYKSDNPMVYMDPAQQDAGVAIKNVRIDGLGITVPAQAWHLARYKQLQNEYLLRSGTFKCDIDAIACRPGNLIILQHDVPEWGWGGRTLTGSTASLLNVDRNDLPWDPATGYSVIVLHPAVQRYAGTVSAAAVITDGTGAVSGTQLTLSSFDNASRVTRCIVNGNDCPILSAAAGTVLITPIPGFTPAAGLAYELFDTDVLETRAVANLLPNATEGDMPALALSTPLSIEPQDFSTYFYGRSGSQKIVRVVTIRRQAEFRAVLEWIDYDPATFSIATPVIGSTSVQVTTKPGVTALVGSESFQLVTGSYISNLTLAWTNGPDTVGVGIYATLLSAAGVPMGTPQLIARIANASGYTAQYYPGVTWLFTVVGYDINDIYAAFTTAPSVTVSFVGVATNLLLGSSFQSGFAFWSITPRAGDTLVPQFDDDGQMLYTVAGTALTTAQAIAFQTIPPAKWAVGDYLMLSAYFLDTALTTANVGQLQAVLLFYNSAGTVISSVTADVALSGTAPALTRCTTAATAIPTGTAMVTVAIGVGGSGLSVQVGSTLVASHLLLEICPLSSQTTPSTWADIDANGTVLDLFTSGSSTGLRVQGSTLPSFTGIFSVPYTDTTATPTWTGLAILWPDQALTYIPDGSLAVTGLVEVTRYFLYPYFDVINGGLKFVVPATPVGSPAICSTAYDAVADAATRQDGRVPFAPGGLTLTTAVTGHSGTGTGGGGTGSGGTGGGGFGGGIPSQPTPGTI